MKKIFFVIIFALLLFGAWQNCYAVDLLLKYPDVPGAQSPNETSDLPNLINYIYKFALLACGITAFVSILIGAIQYVTSAGNSSKAGEAKDRITSALWGILILLSSVLILGTINPDLISLKLDIGSTPTTPGTTENYKCLCCCIKQCVPTNPINRIPAWGYAECKKTTFTQAQSDCKNACDTECIDWPPDHEENYKATLCQ